MLALATTLLVALVGIYDSCTHGCYPRLRAASEAGFHTVLNYATETMDARSSQEYASDARRANLSVIWNVAREGVPVSEKLPLVASTASEPNTWGYYVGDEVPVSQVGEVAALTNAIHAITRHPTLYVSRPGRRVFWPFVGAADYVGPDTYPIGGNDPGVCKTARWSSRVTHPVMVLQAFSWSIDYPSLAPVWPTYAQMRKMRRNAYRCSARKPMILWFCQHCVTDFDAPPTLWGDLSRVVRNG